MVKRAQLQEGSRNPPPRRALSQNFLVDRAAAERIVAAFAPRPEDEVLEIGPGRGALTDLIAGRVRRLVALELDRGLAAALAARLALHPGVTIEHQDALAIGFASHRHDRPLRLIANLPYGISSPFVLKLLDELDAVADATLLFQLEFAARLHAAPGGKDYGSLSVLAQSRVAITPLLDLGPASFRPRPRVESRLVRLTPLATPLVSPGAWAALQRLLRFAFSGRRKTLANALARGFGRSRDEVAAALAAAGVDPGTRAERLDPATWAALAGGPLATF
jgi:16S rRNA (adenine1518-N6/adenine1519-N6)-dimethyltransferase